MPMWNPAKCWEELGVGKSTGYQLIVDGLMVPLVKVSPNRTAADAEEVLAVKRARLAGKTEDEIRALVARLIAARQEVAA